jgi:iron complex outermembrane receptor protein
VTGPTYRIKGGELQFAVRATEGLTVNASMSYNDSKQTTSPCIHSAGVTPTTPGNPTPAGACITQVRSGNTNVAVSNPLGAIDSTPAFSPKFQANARVRYEWSAANNYRWFAMAGINHVGEMSNQPSSFTSGDGVLIPYTTWLRYTMPAYNTYDAAIGFAKDTWEASFFGQNLSDSNASTFTTSGQDIKAIVPLRPRVLGVKIAIKF